MPPYWTSFSTLGVAPDRRISARHRSFLIGDSPLGTDLGDRGNHSLGSYRSRRDASIPFEFRDWLAGANIGCDTMLCTIGREVD